MDSTGYWYASVILVIVQRERERERERESIKMGIYN
jgi:hypothetical protein